MRALPPIPDLSAFLLVTPFVLHLTNVSMLSNNQFPNSKNVPQAQTLANLGNEIQIRGPPNQIEGSVEDGGGTWVHQYMKVMEKGTNYDNVGQRS